MTSTDASPARSRWYRRDPDRWARERQSLRDAGWAHRLRYDGGVVSAWVDYPLSGAEPEETVRLRVVWPHSYPWARARVYDQTNQLQLGRHRDPLGGLLCLVHDGDADPNQTAAGLVAQQLPKLLAAASPDATEGSAAERRLELPVADPITAYARARPRILVPADPVPSDVSSGALVAKLLFSPQGRLETGAVETFLGPDDLHLDLPPVDLTAFHATVFGSWIRDPGFDPTRSAGQTWDRVKHLLPELDVVHPDPSGIELEPAVMTLIGLLVPVEREYRTPGHEWVFLCRTTFRGDDGCTSRATTMMRSQELELTATAHRTPIAAGLKDKKVVLVGCGAIGHHIATDLARTGIGRLDLVDKDHTDIGASARQWAPYASAGQPKTGPLAKLLGQNNPAVQIEAWNVDALHIYEPTHDPAAKSEQDRFMRKFREADLIIDATANRAVTGLLNAISQQHQVPLLAVGGTPGMWGGWVLLSRPGRTGCWECLTLHRNHAGEAGVERWPVPLADPDGWATPLQCSEPTFTGVDAEVASISFHAARVAVHHVAEDIGLGGDYYVAALRRPDGLPAPVSWSATVLGEHPECGVHPLNDQALWSSGTQYTTPRQRV